MDAGGERTAVPPRTKAHGMAKAGMNGAGTLKRKKPGRETEQRNGSEKSGGGTGAESEGPEERSEEQGKETGAG